jgi:signal transduction histidine kinase
VSGDDASLAVDRPLVERAVRNLLANARRHRRAVVQASVERAPGRVWIHVDDDGAGIDPALRAHVFRRFARLDAARTADGGGAGLGLSIVASVAAAHGGAVEVAESPLGGARLSMWLPDPPQ